MQVSLLIVNTVCRGTAKGPHYMHINSSNSHNSIKSTLVTTVYKESIPGQRLYVNTILSFFSQCDRLLQSNFLTQVKINVWMLALKLQ